MQLWIALVVTGLGLVAWLPLVRQSPDMPASKITGSAVVLPIAALVVTALAPEPVHRTTQGAIGLGLLLTAIAAALIHSKFLPAYSGYAHLVITYVLYAIAFTLAARGLRLTPWLLVLLLFAGLLTYRLYFRLGVLWGTLMLVGGLLFFGIWAALSWSVTAPSLAGGPLALAGIALIALVHAAQVLGQYAPLPRLTNPAFAYSLPAHLLVAWSVWGQMAA